MTRDIQIVNEFGNRRGVIQKLSKYLFIVEWFLPGCSRLCCGGYVLCANSDAPLAQSFEHNSKEEQAIVFWEGIKRWLVTVGWGWRNLLECEILLWNNNGHLCHAARRLDFGGERSERSAFRVDRTGLLECTVQDWFQWIPFSFCSSNCLIDFSWF